MYRTLLRRVHNQARRALTTKIQPTAPGNGPNHRSIMALDGNTIRPFVQPNAFIAPSASVIGSVVVNDKTAVMYGAVIRGDLALIQIGAVTTIGENSILTAGAVDGALSPADAMSTGLAIEPELFVGDYVFIGANCALHSCRVENCTVIGHCTTIAEGAHVGFNAVVEPNSYVEEGTIIGDNEVWGGSPAKKIRVLTDDDVAKLKPKADANYTITAAHAYEFLPKGTVYWEKERMQKDESLKQVVS